MMKSMAWSVVVVLAVSTCVVQGGGVHGKGKDKGEGFLLSNVKKGSKGTPHRPLIGIYSSGNEPMSAYSYERDYSELMTSACAAKVDWKFVHYGWTHETSHHKFSCPTGSDNCKWMEAMNCYQSLSPEAITSEEMLKLVLLGQKDVSALLEQLPSGMSAKVSHCVSSGKGSKLLHHAGKDTSRHIYRWNNLIGVQMTLDGNQYDIHQHDLWQDLCEHTKATECCGRSSLQYKQPITSHENVKEAVVDTITQRQALSSHKAASPAASQKIAEKKPQGELPSLAVYLGGNDLMTGQALSNKLAPILWSPCGEAATWDFIFAGQSYEKSPNVFSCPPGNDCNYLKFMNCVAKESKVKHNVVNFALEARHEGKFDMISPFREAVYKCTGSKEGSTLFHDAIEKTKKNIKWSPAHSSTITINGKQDDTMLEPHSDIWKHMCDITKADVCCVNAPPPPPPTVEATTEGSKALRVTTTAMMTTQAGETTTPTGVVKETTPELLPETSTAPSTKATKEVLTPTSSTTTPPSSSTTPPIASTTLLKSSSTTPAFTSSSSSSSASLTTTTSSAKHLLHKAQAAPVVDVDSTFDWSKTTTSSASPHSQMTITSLILLSIFALLFTSMSE